MGGRRRRGVTGKSRVPAQQMVTVRRDSGGRPEFAAGENEWMAAAGGDGGGGRREMVPADGGDRHGRPTLASAAGRDRKRFSVWFESYRMSWGNPEANFENRPYDFNVGR